VKVSATVTAEAPAGVVTVMYTVPSPGGLRTVSWVGGSPMIFPAVPPKLTLVAPSRPVPVIVTSVPPAGLPLAGETSETTGSDEPDDD
jgi:hypothetical protein